MQYLVPFELAGSFVAIWPRLRCESAVADRTFIDPDSYEILSQSKRLYGEYIVLSEDNDELLEYMEHFISSQEVLSYVKQQWNERGKIDRNNVRSIRSGFADLG